MVPGNLLESAWDFVTAQFVAGKTDFVGRLGFLHAVPHSTRAIAPF